MKTQTSTITKTKLTLATGVALIATGAAALIAIPTLQGPDELNPREVYNELSAACADDTCKEKIQECFGSACGDKMIECLFYWTKDQCGFLEGAEYTVCAEGVRSQCMTEVLQTSLAFNPTFLPDFSAPPQPPLQPATACTDSDAGVVYEKKGVVVSSLFPQGKEDYCYAPAEGVNYLIEGICENNQYIEVQKNCQELGSDYSCKEGICVQKPWCTKTAEGIVKENGEVKKNYCFATETGQVILAEYACPANKNEKFDPVLTIDCSTLGQDYQCVSGTCTSLPTPCSDSDGGENVNLQGFVFSSGVGQKGDYCDANNKKILHEMTCVNGKQQDLIKDCSVSKSFECVQGACIENKYCGNGIVEYPEDCDDGNTINEDQCDNSCIEKIKSCWAYPITVVAKDDTGNILSGVTITGYEETNPAITTTDDHYLNYKNNSVFISGKTDSAGQFVINNKGAPSKMVLVATYGGHLTALRGIACGSGFTHTLTLKKLESLSEGQPDTPVKIQLDEAVYSRYQKENRSFVVPYILYLRPDMLEQASSVDVATNIVSQVYTKSIYEKNTPAWMPKAQNPDFYQVIHEKNVLVGRQNSTKISLPAGMYYLYFTVTIHDKNGGTKAYDYYPRIFQWSGFISAKLIDLKNIDEKTVNGMTTFLVYPDQKQGDLIPVAGATTQGAPINVVLLNVGFEKQLFANMVEFIVNSGKAALTKIEPFTSNKSQFAFWYYPDIFTANDLQWTPSDFDDDVFGSIPLSKGKKMYVSHSFSGKTIFLAIVNDETIAINTVAGSGKCQFKAGITFAIAKKKFQQCLSSKNADDCFEEFNLNRIVNHEIAHDLALVGEEYYGFSALFSTKAFTSLFGVPYNPNFRLNTFLGDFSRDQYCFEVQPQEKIFCQDPPVSQCEKSDWYDLRGNGCGKDGIIDCDKNDPLSAVEVGCFPGAGYAGNDQSFPDLLKPTRVSVMSYGFDYLNFEKKNSQPTRIYGAANERSLCRAIKEYAGSAGGICSSLCLDGCVKGKQCIQGVCQ